MKRRMTTGTADGTEQVRTQIYDVDTYAEHAFRFCMEVLHRYKEDPNPRTGDQT